MREFLLANGPVIAAVLAAGELLFGILLIRSYLLKKKTILLLMAVVLSLCAMTRQSLPAAVSSRMGS